MMNGMFLSVSDGRKSTKNIYPKLVCFFFANLKLS